MIYLFPIHLLQSYLNKYKFGNAETKDLWNSLSEVRISALLAVVRQHAHEISSGFHRGRAMFWPLILGIRVFYKMHLIKKHEFGMRKIYETMPVQRQNCT